jgi:gas vesicle protein
MRQEGNPIQSFILGAVVGGAVGAGLALLFAPKKGSELRADIAETVGDAASRLREAIGSVRETAEELFNEGKERGDKLIQEAAERAEDLINEADRVIAEVRSKI